VDNRALKYKSRTSDVSGVPNPETKGFGGPKGVPKGAAFGPPQGALGKFTGDQGAPKSEGAKAVGKYVNIPEKYYSPDTSGLTMTVKRGDQTQAIELTAEPKKK
jgi:hypothetical protein